MTPHTSSPPPDQQRPGRSARTRQAAQRHALTRSCRHAALVPPAEQRSPHVRRMVCAAARVTRCADARRFGCTATHLRSCAAAHSRDRASAHLSSCASAPLGPIGGRS